MSASKTSTAVARRSRAVPPERGAQLAAMRRAPTHPGEVLFAEFLEPAGVSQAEAARRMGISLNRLNEIVVGKRAVTPETAVLLSALTGTSAEFWARLQTDYDLWHALRETDAAHVKPLSAA